MVKKIHDIKLNRLPKWAQEYIHTIINQIEVLEAEKLSWFNLPSENAQIVLPYFHDTSHNRDQQTDQGLSRNQNIYFYPDENSINWRGKISIRIDHERNCLNIMGGGVISVEPQASNAVNIRINTD